MPVWMIPVAIAVPFFGGIALLLPRFHSPKLRNVIVFFTVLAGSVLTWANILNHGSESFVIVKFTDNLNIALKIDGLSCVFAGLVATLWPFSTYYAFEYMKHEGFNQSFFAFYTMTLGVTVGIAFSANLLTLYFFYELLTLVTVPLVMHGMTKKSVHAARKYLYYSLGGAAFAFIGLVFIITYGNSIDFSYGGVITAANVGGRRDLLLFIYVLTFCGFGVKAAIFPFYSWLISAAVAPVPVTALLHAVAVVKSGAFAIMRATYFSFGTDFLCGTWAQTVVMTMSIVTILFGSVFALKERHLKRRLAYSTVSNLSYILFGCSLMTPAGLAAGMAHMLFHGLTKICSFFCTGAIMHQTGKEYVSEMNGLGKKMPITFTCFTISALSLSGVPLFAGFVSKWRLGSAAMEVGNPLAIVGVGALLISALLTALYMFTVSVRGFFPSKDGDALSLASAKDGGVKMSLPLIVFSVGMIVFGCWSQPILDLLARIAAGM